MILEIGSKGFVGPSIFWPLKMGLKRRKVENHCFKLWFLTVFFGTNGFWQNFEIKTNRFNQKFHTTQNWVTI